MRKKLTILFIVALFPMIFAGIQSNEFLILAWNDLGMHCANKDFSNLAILPPYNNQKSQVVKKGDATNLPQLITSNVSITYEIPGNTYSVGKTNFWTFAQQLFGVTLAPNIGLTGAGLTGNMALDAGNNVYHVDGIPITPYQDNNLVTENPYQLTLIKLYDGSNNLLASTQSVIPVSNEINCLSSGCHSSETSIINEHEDANLTPPVLCANCHADNALGLPGQPDVPSFSFVMHDKHKNKTNDCYKCHPGPNTQCFRDTMHTAGMTCQNCHGDVANVAQTIENGRQPWLQEPSCGEASCHGDNYAPETGKLYRQSHGHAGLYCSACHGSPHAVQPTTQPNDNVQNTALQGFRGTLRKCSVCHGVTPTSPGPHGLMPSAIETISSDFPSQNELLPNFPNPVNESTAIPFRIANSGKVFVDIFSSTGRYIMTVVNQHFAPGEYVVKINAQSLLPGIYFYRLKVKNSTDTKKFLVIK